MAISSENKLIARHALAAFGGNPNVRAFHHDTESLSVDILRCDNRPSEGVTAYSTIGLSDHPLFKGNEEFPARLEIAGACATSYDLFPNVLASAAFCNMRNGRLYSSGVVMPGYVGEYFPATPVPHLYFTAPFLWDDKLTTLDCGVKKVSWLLTVPISQGEREFLERHGDDALEDLFEEHQIDVFDLERTSVA